MAQAVKRLGAAVRVGMTLALIAAIGASVVAWRTHLLPGPLAILMVLCFAVPWAVAHRMVSRSRRSDPFPHVDRRITLP
jgi:hypothetical protein